MKVSSALAALAAAGVSCAPAFAQQPPAAPKPKADDGSGFYVGAGINLYFLDKEFAAERLPITFIDQPSPAALMGRAGYAFNQYVSVEGEVGIGGARSEYEVNGSGSADGEIGIGTAAGAHVLVSLPIGGGGYLFGKAGYVTATVEREFRGVSAPDLDLNGGSFGVGGGFRTGHFDWRMEYSFMSSDGADGVLGMGFNYHF